MSNEHYLTIAGQTSLSIPLRPSWHTYVRYVLCLFSVGTLYRRGSCSNITGSDMAQQLMNKSARWTKAVYELNYGIIRSSLQIALKPRPSGDTLEIARLRATCSLQPEELALPAFCLALVFRFAICAALSCRNMLLVTFSFLTQHTSCHVHELHLTAREACWANQNASMARGIHHGTRK
jgi:hypothetical protein